jgi:integrase
MLLKHRVIPGKAILYRRSRSSRWQVRLKLNDGSWHRVSTGELDLEEASTRAITLYYQTQAKAELNLPQTTRRFKSVAELVIRKIEQAKAANRAKKVYDDYVRVINNYLIPYFGKFAIDKIDAIKMNNYELWRGEKMGKTLLAKSTLNTHNSALTRIFDLAYDRNFIGKTQIPLIKNEGVKTNTRPHFNPTEVKEVITKIDDWAIASQTKKGTKASTRMLRNLLTPYVMMLYATGARAGGELLNAKWKDIDWHETSEGNRFIRIRVDGKTGVRQLIANHAAMIYLIKLIELNPDFNGQNLRQIIDARLDEYVFVLENGDRPESDALANNFRIFLQEHNLLKASDGTARTLYSLRHTYATQQLVAGTTIHQLAKQLGNSSQMVEQHYSKLSPSLIADQLAGNDWTGLSELKPRKQLDPDSVAGRIARSYKDQ